MTSIVEFIEARLDEDEATAKLVRRPLYVCEPDGCIEPEPATDENLPNHHGCWHSFYDPMRMLADIAAKRLVVEAAGGYIPGWPATDNDADTQMADILQALASVYDQHPDFREEWRLKP